MSSWYAVHTHAHSEMKAAVNLMRQGFEIYLPQFQKTRRHARRTEIIKAPLFPRYLFLHMNIEMERWRAVHSTVGVKSLVCFGDQPATISNNIIDDIRTTENEQGCVVLHKKNRLNKGDKIRLLNGPFSESLGLVDGMPDNDRVYVLLNILGRQVKTRVPLESVSAYS